MASASTDWSPTSRSITTLTPKVELYINGWNIFNSKFEPVNGYQMPGPTVLAGARTVFELAG